MNSIRPDFLHENGSNIIIYSDLHDASILGTVQEHIIGIIFSANK